MKYLSNILFISALLMIFSCRKEINRPSWDVDVSFPVINSSMGLDDIIPDSLLFTDTDGKVSLIFNQSVFKLELDTLLNLPDTTIKDTFSIPPLIPSINVNPGQTIITVNENKRFELDDIELTEIKIRNGQTSFQLSSTITAPTIYEYTISNALKDGIPFQMIVNVPAGSQTNPAVVSGSFDFSGYEMDLRGLSGNEYNKYRTTIKVKLDPTANPTTVYNSDKVIVENTFSELRPSYAEGYFGSQEIEVPYQETMFDFLRNINGGLDLDQVDINFEIINGIGVDARVKIDTLKSINTRTNNEVLLNHSFIGNSININRALQYGLATTASTYNILMNLGNSNADLFLENLPDIIGTSLGITINPLGNVSGHQDFLYDDQTFDVRVNAEIPLNLIATNLSLTDTIHLTIDSESADNVNEGVLHVFADNGFPFSAELQIYLLDDNGLIMDSIVSPNLIYPAYTNTSLIVTSNRETRLDIHLNNSQLEHLLNSQRVVLKTIFNTSSLTQHVQLYNSYRMGVRITTELNYTIE